MLYLNDQEAAFYTIPSPILIPTPFLIPFPFQSRALVFPTYATSSTARLHIPCLIPLSSAFLSPTCPLLIGQAGLGKSEYVITETLVSYRPRVAHVANAKYVKISIG